MGFLEVPVFTHGDPKLWLGWMEEFFIKKNLTDLEKMAFAHGFIEDQAFSWLQWRQSICPFMCWEEMKIGLLRRFGNPHNLEPITPRTLLDGWTTMERRLECLSPTQAGLFQEQESSNEDRFEKVFAQHNPLERIQLGQKQEALGASASHEPLQDAAGCSKMSAPATAAIVVTSPLHESHEFHRRQVEMSGFSIYAAGTTLQEKLVAIGHAHLLHVLILPSAHKVFVKMPHRDNISERRPQHKFAKDWQFKYK